MDNQILHKDRRRPDMATLLQTFVFPAIIAALSAYMSVQITISTLELDVNYLKRDFAAQKLVVEQLRKHGAELQARGVWMDNVDATLKRQQILLDRIDKDIDQIKASNQ